MFLYFPSVFSCVALSQWQSKKAKFDSTNLESLFLPILRLSDIRKEKIKPRKKIHNNGFSLNEHVLDSVNLNSSLLYLNVFSRLSTVYNLNSTKDLKPTVYPQIKFLLTGYDRKHKMLL